MKRIMLLVLASMLLSGCGAISKQINTMNQMKNYVFNASADTVYAGAAEIFNQDKLPLTKTGPHSGTSHWKKMYKAQGSLSHYENIRFRVVVTPMGDHKSILRVNKESVPDKSGPVYINAPVGSEMLKPDSIRYIPYEFRILQHINPAAAAQIEANAARM